jgi:hypothetical protein
VVFRLRTAISIQTSSPNLGRFCRPVADNIERAAEISSLAPLQMDPNCSSNYGLLTTIDSRSQINCELASDCLCGAVTRTVHRSGTLRDKCTEEVPTVAIGAWATMKPHQPLPTGFGGNRTRHLGKWCKVGVL